MTSRQAKKIVKRHAIRCRRRIDGPENVVTSGTHAYPEATYRRALRIILRNMDREVKTRAPGAIERLAKMNAERNAARLAVLKARAA